MRKPRHSSVVDKLNLMKFQFQLSPELIQSTRFLSHTRPVQLAHNIVTEFRSNISISTLFFVCWFYVHNIFFVFINIEIYVNNISNTVLPSPFLHPGWHMLWGVFLLEGRVYIWLYSQDFLGCASCACRTQNLLIMMLDICRHKA